MFRIVCVEYEEVFEAAAAVRAAVGSRLAGSDGVEAGQGSMQRWRRRSG